MYFTLCLLALSLFLRHTEQVESVTPSALFTQRASSVTFFQRETSASRNFNPDITTDNFKELSVGPTKQPTFFQQETRASANPNPDQTTDNFQEHSVGLTKQPSVSGKPDQDLTTGSFQELSIETTKQPALFQQETSASGNPSPVLAVDQFKELYVDPTKLPNHIDKKENLFADNTILKITNPYNLRYTTVSMPPTFFTPVVKITVPPDPKPNRLKMPVDFKWENEELPILHETQTKTNMSPDNTANKIFTWKTTSTISPLENFLPSSTKQENGSYYVLNNQINKEADSKFIDSDNRKIENHPMYSTLQKSFANTTDGNNTIQGNSSINIITVDNKTASEFTPRRNTTQQKAEVISNLTEIPIQKQFESENLDMERLHVNHNKSKSNELQTQEEIITDSINLDSNTPESKNDQMYSTLQKNVFNTTDGNSAIQLESNVSNFAEAPMQKQINSENVNTKQVHEKLNQTNLNGIQILEDIHTADKKYLSISDKYPLGAAMSFQPVTKIISKPVKKGIKRTEVQDSDAIFMMNNQFASSLNDIEKELNNFHKFKLTGLPDPLNDDKLLQKIQENLQKASNKKEQLDKGISFIGSLHKNKSQKHDEKNFNSFNSSWNLLVKNQPKPWGKEINLIVNENINSVPEKPPLQLMSSKTNYTQGFNTDIPYDTNYNETFFNNLHKNSPIKDIENLTNNVNFSANIEKNIIGDFKTNVSNSTLNPTNNISHIHSNVSIDEPYDYIVVNETVTKASNSSIIPLFENFTIPEAFGWDAWSAHLQNTTGHNDFKDVEAVKGLDVIERHSRLDVTSRSGENTSKSESEIEKQNQDFNSSPSNFEHFNISNRNDQNMFKIQPILLPLKEHIVLDNQNYKHLRPSLFKSLSKSDTESLSTDFLNNILDDKPLLDFSNMPNHENNILEGKGWNGIKINADEKTFVPTSLFQHASSNAQLENNMNIPPAEKDSNFLPEFNLLPWFNNSNDLSEKHTNSFHGVFTSGNQGLDVFPDLTRGTITNSSLNHQTIMPQIKAHSPNKSNDKSSNISNSIFYDPITNQPIDPFSQVNHKIRQNAQKSWEESISNVGKEIEPDADIANFLGMGPPALANPKTLKKQESITFLDPLTNQVVELDNNNEISQNLGESLKMKVLPEILSPINYNTEEKPRNLTMFINDKKGDIQTLQLNGKNANESEIVEPIATLTLNEKPQDEFTIGPVLFGPIEGENIPPPDFEFSGPVLATVMSNDNKSHDLEKLKLDGIMVPIIPDNKNNNITKKEEILPETHVVNKSSQDKINKREQLKQALIQVLKKNLSPKLQHLKKKKMVSKFQTETSSSQQMADRIVNKNGIQNTLKEGVLNKIQSEVDLSNSPPLPKETRSFQQGQNFFDSLAWSSTPRTVSIKTSEPPANIQTAVYEVMSFPKQKQTEILSPNDTSPYSFNVSQPIERGSNWPQGRETWGNVESPLAFSSTDNRIMDIQSRLRNLLRRLYYTNLRRQQNADTFNQFNDRASPFSFVPLPTQFPNMHHGNQLERSSRHQINNGFIASSHGNLGSRGSNFFQTNERIADSPQQRFSSSHVFNSNHVINRGRNSQSFRFSLPTTREGRTSNNVASNRFSTNNQGANHVRPIPIDSLQRLGFTSPFLQSSSSRLMQRPAMFLPSRTQTSSWLSNQLAGISRRS